MPDQVDRVEPPPPPPPSPPGVRAHHVSAPRLFGVILLFLIATGYAIWKSDRFQNLIHGVSQSRLAEALGRPVSFQTVDFRIFPPSVLLADVRIGNDPRLKGPLFTAEEVSIGGGISFIGNELRIGKVRAIKPRAALTQFPDGTWNLPPGLTRPSRQGGVKVEISSVVVQEGVIDVNGQKLGIDGDLEGFAAELAALNETRYRGTLDSRKATLKLKDSEPIVARLSARFELESSRGITFDDVRLSGSFGRLQAAGAVETTRGANVVVTASGEISVDEVERIFHSPLGFSGGARLAARIEVPPSGSFSITGSLSAPRVVANDMFTFENVAASIAARPAGLVARIERLDYAGGRATGVFRIANLTSKPQPMTLALEAAGLSMERFFGDIGLKGTGLSGAATLTAALRWGEAGIARADGGGMLQLVAGPASSIVPGRSGTPVSGGGALAIAGGRIGFEGVDFRFPQSSLTLTGGLKFGEWQPDFDFQLKSRDFTEVDRLFQNFMAAGGEKAEKLGLGGSGEVKGHVAGKWAEPDATAEVDAQDTRFSGVSFASVRGAVDMRDGAFWFHPLRVSEGDAGLTLEGNARYKQVPGKPRFDLAVSARGYPLPRLLQYLELDFPVAGRVTGDVHVSGTPPDAIAGGGAIELADAVVWGQKLARLTGNVRFDPDRFGIDSVRADLGGGEIRGEGSLAIRERTFDAKLSAKGVALESVSAFEPLSGQVTARLTFDLAGSGSLDHPDLKVTASLAQANFYGRALPDDLDPRLDATMTRGVLDATASVPRHWTLQARGDLFGKPPKLDVALDAADLGTFLALTPLTLPAGYGGSLAVNGNLTLSEKAGELPSGSFTAPRVRLDFPGHPSALTAKGDIHAALAGGRLTVQEFEVLGAPAEVTDIKLGGWIALDQKPVTFSLAASGAAEASLLTLISPDLNPSGRLTADVRAAGTLDAPSFSGTIRFENGKYRMATFAQVLDDIDASVTFRGSRGEVEARARTGGGDVFVSGTFGFKGLAPGDFRVSLNARRVAVHYPQDLRLVVDADLVATGSNGSNIVRGEVVLQRGTYSKDIGLTISDLVASSRPAGVAIAQEPWKARTTLEIRIVSAASLEVRNNLARLGATVDLFARGSVADPRLVGQIVLDEGGRINFQDVRYEVESGVIAFANTAEFAPIIDLHLRAQLKSYDISVGLVGTWPRIQTSFSSEPPLAEENIMGLLLTGTAPSTPGAAQGSFVSTAGSLVGSAATGFVTRPTQRLFKLDRFQIDPVFSGSGPVDIRSTVGKQITPDLLVTYSQSFDTSKEPIFNLEWWISETVVVQGRRDENGLYLIDVRRRQRL